jgi:hypothetical protein
MEAMLKMGKIEIAELERATASPRKLPRYSTRS